MGINVNAFSEKLKLFRNLCFIGLLNIILGTPTFAQQDDRVDLGRLQTDVMHPFVQDSRTKHELLMDMHNSEEATDTTGVTWKLGIGAMAVPGQTDAQDYRLTWTVTKGQVDSVSVGIVKVSNIF